MGAPGEALFCKSGHLYKWIDEHLYWDEDTYKVERGFIEKGCSCGSSFEMKVPHYSELTDCMYEKQLSEDFILCSETKLVLYGGNKLFQKVIEVDINLESEDKIHWIEISDLYIETTFDVYNLVAMREALQDPARQNEN